MLGSVVLDVAVGLVLMYLLLALVCSALRETIESVVKSRSAHLERGIRELLHDPQGVGLAAAVYRHPLVHGLFNGEYDPRKLSRTGWMPLRTALPSYIPARSFALALLDIAARGPHVGDPASATSDAPELTLDGLRATITHIDNPPVQRVLLLALDTARGDLARAQAAIEAWFDSSMDRVSGAYKRRTHQILFLLGLAVTVALNADSVAVAQSLFRDSNLRAGVVATAERVVAEDAPPSGRSALAELEALELPIGWPRDHRFDSSSRVWNEVSPLLGWLLTALAIALGAPFWFDILNRVMVIRSTVKPHEKSPEEGSEDRQPRGGGARPPQVIEVVAAPPGSPGASAAKGAMTPSPAAPVASPAAGSADGGTPHEWAGGDPDEGVL